MEIQTITEKLAETNYKYQNVEKYLTTILLQLEIPTKNKGFFFIKEAVKIAYNNPLSRFNLHEKIYKVLADKYSTTSSKVERSIRHALAIATDQKKMNNFEKLFNIKNNFSILHPSVGEFISLLAESINFIDTIKL